jgi:hypothetical protein
VDPVPDPLLVRKSGSPGSKRLKKKMNILEKTRRILTNRSAPENQFYYYSFMYL